MPSPYRETDNVPRTPSEALARRRRVLGSARWAEVLAASSILLLLAGHWLPARFALVGGLAWLIMGAALVVATWMYTTTRSRSTVNWQGWLLRASVAVGLGATALPLLGIQLGVASYILGVLLVGAAIPYLLSLRTVRVQWSPRQWVLYGACVLVFMKIIEYLPLQPAWRILGFCLAGAAASGTEKLRRTLLPTEHEWWFDNQTGTPGEWIALFVYRDGQAEVPWDDDRPRWFASKEQAVWWLSNQGYLPAERALAEPLVDRIPTETLPLLKPRKLPRPRKNKQRVRDEEPRFRVDAEAEAVDEQADELEEPAPDIAEPRPAVAVRDPQDPRR